MTRDETLEQIADRIEAIRLVRPARVAIDGVDAAGKTTLADELAGVLAHRGREVIRASVDGFHNPRTIRYRHEEDSPEGYYEDSFDYAALDRLLLGPLGPGGSRRFRRAAFDFRDDAPVHAPVKIADQRAVLLFDGVFLQRPELAGRWELTVFVDVDFDVSVERAVRRDAELFGGVEAARVRYRSRYVPGQRLYVARCRPRERADVVVGNDDPEHPTILIRR